MKHKVSELEGALLEDAIAKAEGCQRALISVAGTLYDDWSFCGPIIDRERIFFSELPMHEGGPDVMVARCGRTEARGRGHLIAAMRAYVASKFGEDIELQS